VDRARRAGRDVGAGIGEVDAGVVRHGGWHHNARGAARLSPEEESWQRGVRYGAQPREERKKLPPDPTMVQARSQNGASLIPPWGKLHLRGSVEARKQVSLI